ncbi:hypothetical protein WM34_05545 [Burkholderia ubonensis]|uniref:hypothetical protein n=1 Tax=Burkholderia ubonensis TaxID=101571 RepID=UPI0007535CF1|nr:hypothetical protein [Burkholderia ubonensis]KVT01069.1 hypothetical protein WK46_18830 [Burkholderia ubonensis]KWD11984.1 hypothetical protein WL59_32225 [Burkholderia ubonensis]KWD16137.1 hypothetical protein WL60_11125 [Burkholderia ubonensis]KWO98140.1 hypothetical protein WM34_05545 [Burkholderia ubonensis]
MLQVAFVVVDGINQRANVSRLKFTDDMSAVTTAAGHQLPQGKFLARSPDQHCVENTQAWQHTRWSIDRT